MIHLRAALLEDAVGLAELIHIADQAHYATSGYAVSIGGSRAHQLAELTKLARAEARSQFHYSHFDVAVAEDGKVAASVAGFDRASVDTQANAALEEIGWSAEAIQGLVERMGPVGECYPEEEPGTWTIEHVAALPEFRGQGLAPRLLDRALERGKAQGFTRGCVDVFDGNAAALKIYLAAGFRPVTTFGDEPLKRILGRDPLIRLTREF